MDNNVYVDMCNKILNNKECYCKIPYTRIVKFYQEFYVLVERAYAKKY